MDIGWAIIETVDKIPESSDYILIGIFFSILIGATPLMFQAFHAKDLPSMLSWDIFPAAWELACNNSWRYCVICNIFMFIMGVNGSCQGFAQYAELGHLSCRLGARL